MALAVSRYELGPIGTNCYIVRADLGAPGAVVIDPGADAPAIGLELAGMAARCDGILITHGHWDHLGGVADLAEGTGASVWMAEDERGRLERPAEFISVPGISIRPWVPDTGLLGSETIEVGGISFQVVSVPGHSPAHIAYYSDGHLFSGDVLFAGSVGRTDLPGSSWETLVESIRTLVDRFPADTVVHSGHGPETTLGAELARNPFLAELRAS